MRRAQRRLQVAAGRELSAMLVVSAAGGWWWCDGAVGQALPCLQVTAAGPTDVAVARDERARCNKQQVPSAHLMYALLACFLS